MSDPEDAADARDDEEEEAEEEQPAEGERSFREAAEQEELTIGDIVELDEDEEGDEEFDPDEVEDEEEDDDDDEGEGEDGEEGEGEVDEDELEALREADVDGAVERHIESSAAREEEQEEAEAEEGVNGEGEEEGEEEEREEDPLEGGVGLMGEGALSAYVSSVMTADGPTVKTVLLKADGTKEEMVLDMTPRKDRASEVLGSKSSFVGQYPSLHCVILQRRDQDNSALPINAHKLPAPFDNEVVRGDMLLVRMDDRSEPQDFPLTEWEAFERTEGAEAAPNGTADGQGVTEERTSKRQRRR